MILGEIRRLILPILVVLTALCGCGYDPSDFDVLKTVLSPDAQMEASVVVFHGGGPAVGVSEQVFVRKVGNPMRLSDRVFAGERVCDLSATWQVDGSLLVQYAIGPYGIGRVGEAGPWWSRSNTAVRLRRVRRVSSRSCVSQ